ncbi:MAG: molybdenum cofactor biosynthesis protein [Deltaproteobacteria bacterium]|nr:MogA/MoaB family molybdenum cofactor biosynthesis protein [Deltaproteobacteria bacterium]MBW2077025.1 MogA/MoaB family molybdenum cofactor biosynthesis protein [Deltaproteobacteria bacterium]MBW2312284.1 MogA/MoaB family molybdenum cofactor biosynthesis protein [Deltaproteobacteria bacterium]RLB30025.1 MAG: molybdenum cofactor biosynthesis protein [Deltaproteobacteria bacterium]
MIKAGVLTISDKGSRGQRKDLAGPLLVGILTDAGYRVVRQDVVPDNREEIAERLIEWVDKDGLRLVVTTGGTGVSPTDVTPEAMRAVISYQIPGMAEAMRASSLTKTPHAMLSRAMAGVRGISLIINVPGSPKAAEENLGVILPALDHALAKIAGDTSDCATP